MHCKRGYGLLYDYLVCAFVKIKMICVKLMVKLNDLIENECGATTVQRYVSYENVLDCLMLSLVKRWV